MGKEDEKAEDIYGNRNICRGSLEQELQEILPFHTLPMLAHNYGILLYTSDNWSITNGIFCSGKPDGSMIRFAVRIENNYLDMGEKRHRGKSIKKRRSARHLETGVEEGN